MNEWKYQQRRRKRGDHCLISSIGSDGRPYGKLCGCGGRVPPTKRKKTRIIKRTLKRQLMKELDNLSS